MNDELHNREPISMHFTTTIIEKILIMTKYTK